MKIHQANILEILSLNNETCLRLEGTMPLQATAGQYLQAYAVDSTDLLPLLLYPCGNASDRFLYCGAIPKDWQPGCELHLRGPRGNGFHLPPLARRVALTTMDQLNINRLLPLAEMALKNGAGVTLLTDMHPSQLASEIEVLPLSELSQIKGWTDYLAAAMFSAQAIEFTQSLDLTPGKSMPFTAEVMLDAPMICDESAACGICAVFTTRGWKLACKDGPVFSLEELTSEEPIRG